MKLVISCLTLVVTSQAWANPIAELWLRSEGIQRASDERSMSIATPAGEIDVEYKYATVSPFDVTAIERRLAVVTRGAWRITETCELRKPESEQQQTTSIPDLFAMLAALH